MNGAAKGTGNIIALESKGDLGKEKALACHQVHNTIPELQNPFVESNQYWAEYNPTKWQNELITKWYYAHSLRPVKFIKCNCIYLFKSINLSYQWRAAGKSSKLFINVFGWHTEAESHYSAVNFCLLRPQYTVTFLKAHKFIISCCFEKRKLSGIYIMFA